MDALFSKTMETLSLMLEYHSERHKAISSNIVNIDTPGYKPVDVTFDRELVAQIAAQKGRSGSGGTQNGIFTITEEEGKVDIDKEMGKLAENHLMYNLSAELLARKFRGLKDVVRGLK